MVRTILSTDVLTEAYHIASRVNAVGDAIMAPLASSSRPAASIPRALTRAATDEAPGPDNRQGRKSFVSSNLTHAVALRSAAPPQVELQATSGGTDDCRTDEGPAEETKGLHRVEPARRDALHVAQRDGGAARWRSTGAIPGQLNNAVTDDSPANGRRSSCRPSW